MSAGWWESLSWSYFSGPQSERGLFRLVKQRRVRRIVELGVGSVDRAARLIRMGQRYADGEPVSYAGLDWFEERPTEMPAIKLIEAHRQLKATGAEVRLMPGGPAAGLSSVANALAGTDLLLISPDADDAALEAAWFYLPRMTGAESTVLRGVYEEAAGGSSAKVAWSPVSLEEIERLAGQTLPSQAA